MSPPQQMGRRSAGVAAVGVVIPARNEEELLPGCLTALSRAVRRLPARISARVVVVADGCTDGTVRIARRADVDVLTRDASNVGMARAAGFSWLRQTAGSLERLWLVTTDADSRVPTGWLRRQVDFAEAGWDAVVGTVYVGDWADHSPAVARRFLRRYRHSDAGHHPHVHGANLGVSAEAYDAVGGFRPLAVGEDHALVAALDEGRWRVLRTTALPVETSARGTPRAAGGFGHLLMQLAESPEP